MATPFQSKTGRMALGGILTAISVVILYLAAIAPSGRMGVAAVAGLCPVFGVLLIGRSSGYLVWGASSVLALVLLPDKGIALCYLLLFGLYPVVKSKFEGFSSFIIQWLCKLLYGVMGVLLIRHLFLALLMSTIPDWISQNMVLFYPVGILVFIAYDIALSRLIALMQSRVMRQR